jgi:hypothetical protein
VLLVPWLGLLLFPLRCTRHRPRTVLRHPHCIATTVTAARDSAGARVRMRAVALAAAAACGALANAAEGNSRPPFGAALPSGLLCDEGGGAAVLNWAEHTRSGLPPHPHKPSKPPPSKECTHKLEQYCPVSRAVEGQSPELLAKCLNCVLKHTKDLPAQRCSLADRSQHCYQPYLADHQIGADCGTALLDLVEDIGGDLGFNLSQPLRPTLPSDPPHAYPAAALTTWGTTLSDPGLYYSCNAVPGYNYWKMCWVGWKADLYPPDQHNHSNHRVPTGQRRHLQHHHYFQEFCEYEESTSSGLCLPEQCDKGDVRSFAEGFIGILHGKRVADLMQPAAPALSGAGVVMLVVVALFAALALVAAARGSSAWAEASAAMPLPENVEQRVTALLRTGRFSPARAPEIGAMSMLDKWRLVQAAERACREDPSWTELSASAAAVRRSGGRARMQSLAPSVPLPPTARG